MRFEWACFRCTQRVTNGCPPPVEREQVRFNGWKAGTELTVQWIERPMVYASVGAITLISPCLRFSTCMYIHCPHSGRTHPSTIFPATDHLWDELVFLHFSLNWIIKVYPYLSSTSAYNGLNFKINYNALNNLEERVFFQKNTLLFLDGYY